MRSARRDDRGRSDMGREVLLLSSVRIELLEELARRLGSDDGSAARTVGAFADEDWRSARSGGRWTALGARLRALAFPLRVRVGGSTAGRVVIATTNPFWLPAMLAVRRVRPLVTLVYDVYPDALQVRWRLPRAVISVLRWVFGLGLRGADAVVVLGDRIRTELIRRHRPTGRVVVIPTGADPADFAGADPRDLPVEVPDDALLVSYVGNTGSVHDGRTPGIGLAEVLARRSDVHAIIATRGDRAEDLLAPLRGSARATLARDLPSPAYRATMARTDIAIVTLDAGAALTSVPSKVYAALAAGCAVLAVAPHDSDLADLVLTSGAGVVTAPDDVDGFIAALARLLDRPALLAEHRSAAAAHAARFAPEATVAAWREVLRDLPS